MANDRQWDGLSFESLDFPYHKLYRELSDEPRIVEGQNTYVTYGGKIIKRYGLVKVDNTVDTTLTRRFDRLWVYETLDTPSIVYLVGSAYNSGTGTWAMYYLRLDAGGSPVWTSIGSLRDVDASTRPHEAIVSRGLLYIKGYPAAINTEKLGTVIFDGTGGTPSTTFWGLLGPSTPAKISGSVPRLNESSGITASQTTFHLSAQNSTNLLQWSSSLDNTSVWKTATLTVTANNAVAPDGQTTAALLTPGGADSYLYYDAVATSIGQTYTFSVWLKSATGSPSTLNLYMMTSGAVPIANVIVTADNTWQRFSVSGVATTTSSWFTIGTHNTLSTGENLYAWGPQVEAGSSPTEYNKTFGPFSVPAAPFNIQIDYELMTVTAFNTGTGVATVLRGAQGTVAATHNNGAMVLYRDWGASVHPVSVSMFWGYTYAYKAKTGHISNRAPLQTNPDKMPSQTGPFLNLIPKLYVQGHPDTTNVPTIVIYRNTDGGGKYMKVAEITNLGDFPIVYQDNKLVSTSGSADPTPDSALDSQSVAPGLNTNSPPPTVLAPLVTGTDTPAASTPLASYQGRLWFAIGNTLFYSAQEEINAGIPEESWPSGTFGNFYRFQYPIVGLEGTSDALYIVTTSAVYELTGSNLETFNTRLILNNVGGAINHPRAITKYGDALVWLTNDLRIAILQGNNFRTISEPLGTDYINLINNNSAELDIKYWADMENEWLVVGAICPTASDTKVWVYDIKKSAAKRTDFWNTPWTIQTSVIVSGRIRESQQQRRLLFWTGAGTGMLARLSTRIDITGSDVIAGPGGTQTFSAYFKTNLYQVLPGDHVNALRLPGLVPVVYAIYIERTKYDNDTDPTTVFFLNDLWTTPKATLPSYSPARDDEPIGYKTLIYPVNQKARRIAIEIDTPNSADLFELQNMSIIWNSDGGSGI